MDEVIIGAPWSPSVDLIKSLKIDLVVQGTAKNSDEKISANNYDQYSLPIKMGIYKEIESIYI